MSPRRAAGLLFSLAFWTYVAVSSALLFPLALLIRVLSGPFDPRRTLLHRFTCTWAYHYVQLVPWWRPRFEGLEKIDDGRPCVLVANHQSAGDILMLFGLRRHFKWVSKAEVFSVPFIGWNMVLNDYVGLRRGSARSIVAMMDACRDHLHHGSSVMLFPEGTRSPDGNLLPFRTGAFNLAQSEQLPIVPIVLDGTRDVLPKRGWYFDISSVHRVTVRVLDPVVPDADGSAPRLRTLVREKMDAALAEARATKVSERSRAA